MEDETVFENLELGFIGKKLSKKEKKKESISTLKELKIECDLNEKVKKFSGGEKQRIAIGRILIKNPDVIIADEPTGNLDSENENIIFNHLKNMNNKGKTIILITHSNFNIENSKTITLD